MEDMNNKTYEELIEDEGQDDRFKEFTISESNELPSKGLIYDKKAIPQFIELRSMTLRDEMKRCSPSPHQYKATAQMIQDCVVNKTKDLSVYDLALGDYNFLLHKLRIITYGPEYKMSVYCPKCGKYVETIADLDQETVLNFDLKEFNEKQVITLPVSGDLIKIRLQTPRLLDTVTAKIKEYNRKYQSDGLAQDMLVLLTYLIEEVNGQKLDIVRAESYVNSMKAKDMMAIINNANALSNLIGINTYMITDCPVCKGEIETYFRDGQEFFRPTTD